MNEYNSLFLNDNSWVLHPVLLWIVPAIVWTITIWTLFWKGYAVWIAVKNSQKRWFVALLLINTCGLLEIFYLLKIAKKRKADVKRVLLQDVWSIK